MSELKKEMEVIHDKTDFKIEFAGTTQLGEFRYTHGGSVQPGLEYHIHYTNDKEEVFMTGGVHNRSSKIIEKVSGEKSLFKRYTEKKKKFKINYPDKYTPIPTDGDYGIGNLDRYFVQKANNLNGEIFEITKDDFRNKNNLYRYIELNWTISGKKVDVIRINTETIESISRVRGNEQFRKILFPLQLWNPPKGSPDDIQSKLDRRKII